MRCCAHYLYEYLQRCCRTDHIIKISLVSKKSYYLPDNSLYYVKRNSTNHQTLAPTTVKIHHSIIPNKSSSSSFTVIVCDTAGAATTSSAFRNAAASSTLTALSGFSRTDMRVIPSLQTISHMRP